MLKRFSLFIALLVAAPALATAQDFQGYSPAAYEAAVATGQPVVVNFYESWCSRCSTQRRNLSALLEDETYSDVIVLEAIFSETRDLSGSFGINARTSLALIVDGALVATEVGGTSPKRVQALLDQAI